MYPSSSAGRSERVKLAQRVAQDLRQGAEEKRLKGHSVRRLFRHPQYGESMQNSLKRRVENLLGCSVELEAKYNKRNKLVSLTVRKLNTSIPA